MKNLFLGLFMLAGTAVFANNSVETSADKSNVVIEKKETNLEESFWCQWCVSGGGNQYCAEAETCVEAKELARAMYLDDLKKAPQGQI